MHEGEDCPRCDGSGFRPRKRCAGCGEPAGRPSEGGQANDDSAFNNFKVKKAGSNKAVDGTMSYFFGDNSLTLFPDAPLEPNTTYKAVVKGGKHGVKSADGGKLSGVDDPSATFKNGNVSWTFTTGAT